MADESFNFDKVVFDLRNVGFLVFVRFPLERESDALQIVRFKNFSVSQRFKFPLAAKGHFLVASLMLAW